MRRKVALSVGVSAIALSLASCGGGSGSDQSGRIEHDIMTAGTSQLRSAASDYGVSDVSMDDAACVEQGDTQSYKCLAHYTADGRPYKLSVSASCDKNGKCVWQADGDGIAQ